MNNLHYATQRIIDRVLTNANSDAAIWGDEIKRIDPVPVKDLIPELEHLFNNGYDIVLETNQGFDDDGGDCYIAYLIKPQCKDKLHKAWEEDAEDFNLVTMNHLIKNPKDFIQIWAGPY